MDWDKLRVFHAVADAGSLTHAGEQLHLSQSAISRQIRGLEEQLQSTLFHRHARGLLLTEQGELLYEATLAMNKRLNAAAARIRDSKDEVCGDLRGAKPLRQRKITVSHPGRPPILVRRQETIGGNSPEGIMWCIDVIWKLCLAPDATRALSIALRGQGVSCSEVVEGIAETQKSGAFERYKAEVAQQNATLRLTVRCADGYPESKQNCDRAARELSAQAISLDTAGAVLGRYR